MSELFQTFLEFGLFEPESLIQANRSYKTEPTPEPTVGSVIKSDIWSRSPPSFTPDFVIEER
jgi:hypothetical protein